MTSPENPAASHEFEPVTPEISPELQATYEVKRPDIRYPIVCGDDREQTTESQEALQGVGVEQLDTQIRYFGGAAGIERVLALTLIASDHEEKLADLGSTHTDSIKTVIHAVQASSNVTPELHSAENNEGNAAAFDSEREEGVGCAYAASEAAVTTICAEDEAHYALTGEEAQQLYGNTTFIDDVRKANQRYKELRFGDGKPGLNREDYDEIEAPVQILKGQHAPVDQTLVVINFQPDRVSNPAKAHELGKAFYNNDVTQVAEMLIRAFPEYDLDPELLLAVMDQDIRATRAALAHGAEGGAAALEVQRYGTPAEAIAYLHDVKESL